MLNEALLYKSMPDLLPELSLVKAEAERRRL